MRRATALSGSVEMNTNLFLNGIGFLKRSNIWIILLGAALLLSACSANYGGSGDIFGQVESTLRVVLAIAGATLIVAGFALHEFILQVMGFLAGGLLGAFIGALVSGGDGGGIFLGFIAGGILGAILAVTLTCLTIFLGGFFAGVLLFGAIAAGISHDDPSPLVVIIGGIIGGAVIFALYRFWISALTSALGTVLFGLGVGIPVGFWILILIAGIGIQYGVAKATGKDEEVKPGYTKPDKEKPKEAIGYSKPVPMPSPPAQTQHQPVKPISEVQVTNHAAEKVLPAPVPPAPKLADVPPEKPAPKPKTVDEVEPTSPKVQVKTQAAEPPAINEAVQPPKIEVAAVPESQVAVPAAKPEEIVKPTLPAPAPIPAVPQPPPGPVQSTPVTPQKSVSDLPPLPPAREKICKYCKKRIPISSTRCPYCSHDLG